jgi:hypothetical protein
VKEKIWSLGRGCFSSIFDPAELIDKSGVQLLFMKGTSAATNRDRKPHGIPVDLRDRDWNNEVDRCADGSATRRS